MMRGKLAGALLLLLLPPFGVFAQHDNRDFSTRSVEGIVTDAAGKPVSGAVVQLKDTKTLQIRSFYTEANGTYHFAGLNTNVDYELKADHNGATSGTKTLSSFNTQKVAKVNLKLK